ncbi:hypothetical protein X975_02375, partial [Stegodyphus mimosarum]
MAGASGMLENKFTKKKGSDDVPVDACKGWVDSCEFCDKRFNKWAEIDDETVDKIPEKPGALMVSLKNKNITEVVSLNVHLTNIQKLAMTKIDEIKEAVSDKKSKATKSTILVRWLNFNKGDKDICTLCAHWYNNGVLPKFNAAWPGLDILEESEHLVFSKFHQKWCYPKKEAVWKKPKPQSTKSVDVVKRCNWFEPCEICDLYFTPWKSLTDVVDNNLAPCDYGVYMLSAVCGKKREVVYICFDSKNIIVSIKDNIDMRHKWLASALKRDKFANRNATPEVRWMVFKDINSDNACLLYAHWLNADTIPAFNHELPGGRVLDMNKNFVYQTSSKKWCFETDTFKQA